MGSKKIEVDAAIRRALIILDEWIYVTGVIGKYSGYHAELESIIEDAVHCGIQCGLGLYEPLPSEIEQEKQP